MPRPTKAVEAISPEISKRLTWTSDRARSLLRARPLSMRLPGWNPEVEKMGYKIGRSLSSAQTKGPALQGLFE